VKYIILVLCAMAAMASPGFAFDPTGTYTYKEKGFSGEMKVTETGAFPKVLKVEINTVSAEANMCEAEAEEERMITSAKEISSLFRIKNEDYDQPAQFTITFNPKGAIIDVESSSGLCGLNMSFAGTWAKDHPAKLKKAIKKKNPRE
jgi:hypothetical protein